MRIFSDHILTQCVACGSASITRWREKSYWYRSGGAAEPFIIFKCRDCGTGFLNPPPSEELLADIYSSNGHGLQPGSIDFEQVMIREKAYPNGSLDAARMVARAVKLKSSASNKAIDIGSGYGFMSHELLRHGLDVESINPGADENDIFEKMNGFRPKPIMLDEYEPESGAQQFGVAVLAQVLEHLVEPRREIGKVASLLDRGGVLACSVPNFKSIFVSILGTRDNACLWVPEHVNYFTAKGLGDLLESEGLRPMAFDYQTRVPPGALAKRLPKWAAPKVAERAASILQKPMEAILGGLGRGAYMTAYAVKL